jgi:hypothetical protein
LRLGAPGIALLLAVTVVFGPVRKHGQVLPCQIYNYGANHCFVIIVQCQECLIRKSAAMPYSSRIQ